MRPYLFPDGARLGADNAVLHASARRHKVDSYAGPLSVKTVPRGKVAWRVDGRELVVDRSSFLVLGEWQRYSMNIDEPHPVETCCVFFAPGYVERVALDATSAVAAALDEPDRSPPPLPYLSALHGDRERAMAALVQGLAPKCERLLTPSGFEEEFLLVAERLLDHYGEIRRQAERTPAARASTRAELYRRLTRAREALHSAESPLSLAATARAACLSPFHLHRAFKQTFGVTPHEYLTALRLDRARDLLVAGASALDACLAVGFQSPSAFSRVFKSRFGVQPGRAARFARSGRIAGPDPGILDP